MKSIKDELQNIILRDGSTGETSQLKKVQNFLRGHAEANLIPEKQQPFKGEETTAVLAYAAKEDLVYEQPIVKMFLVEGSFLPV